VAPVATLASLAYHDTLAVPAGVVPRRNVCLLWAPRERSYDEPADAPANARTWELLQRNVAHYAAAGARPARVFEYYADGILFHRGIPDLGRIMAADLAAYTVAGVGTVQILMTGRRDWSEPHPNPALFGRLAWRPRP
jgi:hypothetical protein